MSNLKYTTKKCRKCHVEKHSTEFYTRKKHKDGLESHCKDCMKENAKNWYEENKKIANQSSRRNHLSKTYGISLEQYQELLDRQEGKCPVCLRHHTEFPRHLAVDHNHKTGEIRGLLCNNCNHRLIGRHTDTELVMRMAEYISRHTGWYVPKKKRTVKRKPKK